MQPSKYTGRLTDIPPEIIEHLANKPRTQNIFNFLKLANESELPEELGNIMRAAEEAGSANWDKLANLLGFTTADEVIIQGASGAAGIAFAMATVMNNLEAQLYPGAELRLYAEAIKLYAKKCKESRVPYEPVLDTLIYMVKNMAALIEGAIHPGFDEGNFMIGVEENRADDLAEAGITDIINAISGMAKQIRAKIRMAPGYIVPVLERDNGFAPSIYVSQN